MKGFLSYLQSYRIFLASRSPRRNELLKKLGIPFEIWLKDETDENIPDGMSGAEAVCFVAGKKADSFREELGEREILITADTIVKYKQDIFGKPDSVERARAMLEFLSDKEHEVITGVCLQSKLKNRCFAVTTNVSFAPLSKEDIEHYIESCQPFDKAGAYGIQEWIGLIGIRSIRGSYFNVMGLPVYELFSEIKEFINYKND